MIINVSVALIAVAFVVLVYYLVVTLRSARKSLDQLNASMERVEKRVEDLSEESIRLIQSTKQLTDDVHVKIQSFNTLFQSANRIGEAVNEVTTSVKQVSSALSHSVTGSVQKAVSINEKKGSEWIQWVTLTAGLLGKLKRYREAKVGNSNK